MNLLAHLLKEKIVNLPHPKAAVNNSTLGGIKAWMLGAKIVKKKIDPQFQVFGREFHKRLLEPHKKKKLLSRQEEVKLSGMLASMRRHPVVSRLLQDSLKEHTLTSGKKGVPLVEGVAMRGTLDILKQSESTGADPKTTVCPNYVIFVKAAIKYGYPRQGHIYKTLGRLQHFYFIGIQKEQPYRVYLMDLSRFPEECAYYAEETKFLLHFFKTYGLPYGMKLTIRK